MIFSCTSKVLKRVKSVYEIEDKKAENGYNKWYVDEIILNRKKYFIFTNSVTLFSFITYFGTKKEILNFNTIFVDSYEEQLIRLYGVGFGRRRKWKHSPGWSSRRQAQPLHRLFQARSWTQHLDICGKWFRHALDSMCNGSPTKSFAEWHARKPCIKKLAFHHYPSSLWANFAA